VDEMASKHKKTQVTLNWLTSQGKIVTITKATNIDHIK